MPKWAAPVLQAMPGEALFQTCRTALGVDELEAAKQARWLEFDEIESDNENESEVDRDADAEFLRGISEIVHSESTSNAEEMNEEKLESLVLEVNCFKYAEVSTTKCRFSCMKVKDTLLTTGQILCGLYFRNASRGVQAA